MNRLLPAIAAATLALCACRPPHTILRADELESADLTTLMDAQATAFDDVYDGAKGLEPGAVTAAQLEELGAMAATLTATSARLRAFADGREDFARWAEDLHRDAVALGTAAAAADAAAALSALRGMKRSCRNCHDVY